jgi:hypothetical protein
VKPDSANPNHTYSNPEGEITQEGLFPCFLFGPAQVKDPVTTVFQDINFWSNVQTVPITYVASFLPYTTQACVAFSAPAAP